MPPYVAGASHALDGMVNAITDTVQCIKKHSDASRPFMSRTYTSPRSHI